MNENCPHFSNGACNAAAQIVLLHTGSPTVCHTHDAACKLCVSLGGGIEGAPLANRATAGLAAKAVPAIAGQLRPVLTVAVPKRTQVKKAPARKAEPDLPPGVGTEFYKWAKSIKGLPMACSKCIELAKQMNEWGPQGCRDNMPKIMEHMLPRARTLWAKTNKKEKAKLFVRTGGSLKAAFAGVKAAVRAVANDWEVSDEDRDAMLTALMEKHVHKAIERVETNRPFAASQPSGA